MMIYVICIFHLGWYGTKGEWDISQCFMVFSRLSENGVPTPKKKHGKKNKFQGVYYISPQKDREVVQSES
jgi:hypothetical protein